MTNDGRRQTADEAPDPGKATDAERLRGYLEEYIRSLDAGDVADVRVALEERSWLENDALELPDTLLDRINEHLDAAAAALDGPGVDEPGALNHIQSALAHLAED